MRLDGVRLCVPDLPAALAGYTQLLSVTPRLVEGALWRFQLERGAVEVTASSTGPRLAVLFATEDGDDLATWPVDAGEHSGIEVLVISARAFDGEAVADSAIAAIDHVVVRTSDPERAVAHWRDRLGLRLALDRTFPDRKLRLLFFRSGGLTLEYAHATGDPDAPGDDVVYGVSYRVHDLPAVRGRLLAAGLDVSDVRPGMKPGTEVATVRSGTLDVPTLLIQQPARG